jgi:hypothetical protein
MADVGPEIESGGIDGGLDLSVSAVSGRQFVVSLHALHEARVRVGICHGCRTSGSER